MSCTDVFPMYIYMSNITVRHRPSRYIPPGRGNLLLFLVLVCFSIDCACFLFVLFFSSDAVIFFSHIFFNKINRQLIFLCIDMPEYRSGEKITFIKLIDQEDFASKRNSTQWWNPALSTKKGIIIKRKISKIPFNCRKVDKSKTH